MENKGLKLKLSLVAAISIVDDEDNVVNDLGSFDFGTKVVNMDNELFNTIQNMVTDTSFMDSYMIKKPLDANINNNSTSNITLLEEITDTRVAGKGYEIDRGSISSGTRAIDENTNKFFEDYHEDTKALWLSVRAFDNANKINTYVYAPGIDYEKLAEGKMNFVLDKNELLTFRLDPKLYPSLLFIAKEKYENDFISPFIGIHDISDIETYIVEMESLCMISKHDPRYIYKIVEIKDTALNYLKINNEMVKDSNNLFITVSAITAILEKFDIKWSEFEEKIFKLEEITRESLLKKG